MKTRKLTLADFGILEQVESPLVVPSEKPMRCVIDYAFISTHTIDEVLDAVDDWDKTVMKYASDVGMEKIQTLTDEMNTAFSEIFDAQFDVEGSSGKKQKTIK